MTPGVDLDRIRDLARAARSLEPALPERIHLRDAVDALAQRYLEALEAGDAYVDAPDPAAGLLDLPITAEGASVEAAMERLERDVLRPGGHPASGRHLAYLSGGGLYHSALGDYLGAVSNKYPGIFFTGPGPVRMENMLVRWSADLVGYPATAAGHIASGGSLANLAAIVTAREAHELKAADFPRSAVYLTSQAHHCIEKALRLTGLAEAPIRRVAVDEGHRMRPDALEAAIGRDREAGLTPWLVIATAGTTDLGVVDPLEDIGRIAKRQGCWFHVDAAYGGYFLLTEHGRRLLAGIERSDSVVLDPHKSLFLPWGAGIVIARDVRQLVDAHAGSGHYMQDARAAGSELSPADISPELTKPFRALGMWLPLITLGTAPFAAALEEKLLLARYFYDEVQKLGFDVGPPPDLSVVGFRWAPDGATPAEADGLNRGIVDALREDGRVFLSSTELDGRFTIRMAALAHRTHLREIDLTLQLLGEQVEALA